LFEFEVKANAVKQEYEKQDELKRSAMRSLIALQVCIERLTQR